MRPQAKASSVGLVSSIRGLGALWSIVSVCALALVAFLTMTSSAVADPACPNEAIREQQGSTSLPNCRAYEMVSPLDKNGGDVERNTIYRDATSASAPSGDAVAYASRAQFAGIPSGALQAQYVSRRSADGWLTKGINPPTQPDGRIALVSSPVKAFSEDLTSAVVRSNTLFAPQAAGLNGSWGLYREDLGDTQAFYHLLSIPQLPLPPDEDLTNFHKRFEFVAGTPDLGHVVFNSSIQLTADGPPSSSQFPNAVYEWVDGQIRFVSALPDESPAQEAFGGAREIGNSQNYPGDNVISRDGNRIFFTAVGSGQEGPQEGLYMREGGSATVPVTESERSGEIGEVKRGDFLFAKPSDGSVAFFTSSSLTNDSPATAGGGPDLYR